MSSNGFGQGFSSTPGTLGDAGFGRGFYKPFSKIVRDGIVMHFDVAGGSYSGSGNSLIDLSGNGYNGTLYNSPTYSTDNGGVLRYTKSSFQYAAAPNPGDIPKWTIESWTKFNEATVAGTNAIVTGQYDLGSKLNFSLGTVDVLSNTIKAGYFNGAWRIATPGQTVTIGAWYHFVGTYDGSTINFFSNNSKLGTLNYVGTPASGGEIRIARRWDDSASLAGNFISADIPVVRIYNRALSAAEIEVNFNANRNRYGI